MRNLAGLPMPEDIGVPYYLFDESNIETAGVPAEPNKGYGDEYVKGFHKTWMMD